MSIVVAPVIALAVGCHEPGRHEMEDPGPRPPDAADADAPEVRFDARQPPDAPPPFELARCDERRAPLPPLVEDRTVYDQDSPGLWTVHLTISDLAGFDAVNAGVDGAEVPVRFVDGELGADATLRIRGGMSRRNVQKNYKIELQDGARWHGQKEINLNKHMWDVTRMRNKLAFDIFQTIPDFTSLRTHHVQMFVNGESYGLYTWIEEPDKRFLTSHGLDPHGQLYKAVGFSFHEIEPEEAADPAAMSLIVEDKANADDAKFLRMVDAVNDPSRPTEEVIATYFNRDNLITWLAVNVLLNNIDSRTQNFYLYSPSSCEGWYFLPWDYDGAWNFYGQDGNDTRERWERGLANWWMMKLMDRFYRDPANVAAIHDRILELAQTRMTDEVTAQRIAAYRDLVAEHISVMPDLEHVPGHSTSWQTPADAVALMDFELARITPTTSRFLTEYLETLERPMPVHAGLQITPAGFRFRWDDSFDLQHDPIRYDLQIATSPAFAAGDMIAHHPGINDDELTLEPMPSGSYFWRVIIRDDQSPDSWQEGYDEYEELVVP